MLATAKTVFVSYADSEARQHAIDAKAVLQDFGISAWVWHLDRRSAGYVLDEIMDAIERCKFFLYIATASSEASRGQGFERRYAWEQGKDPAYVLAFDTAYIWRGHKIAIRESVSSPTFKKVCRRVAAEIARQQFTDHDLAAVVAEGEAL